MPAYHINPPANDSERHRCPICRATSGCECTVRVVALGELDVDVRPLPIDPQLRQPEVELDSYLRLWAALGKGEAWLVAA